MYNPVVSHCHTYTHTLTTTPTHTHSHTHIHTHTRTENVSVFFLFPHRTEIQSSVLLWPLSTGTRQIPILWVPLVSIPPAPYGDLRYAHHVYTNKKFSIMCFNDIFLSQWGCFVEKFNVVMYHIWFFFFCVCTVAFYVITWLFMCIHTCRIIMKGQVKLYNGTCIYMYMCESSHVSISLWFLL